MKYFLDTEFMEGTQKEKFPISLYRKNTPPTIELISIGIIDEKGREFYAISKDFNVDEAWNRCDEKLIMPSGDARMVYPNGYIKRTYWLRDNVLKLIWRQMFLLMRCDTDVLSYKDSEHYEKIINNGTYDEYFTLKSFKALLKKYGRTNKEIAVDLRNFIYSEKKDGGGQIVLGNFIPNDKPEPEFYAYYADYDWVVFCWLFGKMMDLPDYFPMYCKDLKQMMDEKLENLNWMSGRDCWSNEYMSIHTIGRQCDCQEKDYPAPLEEKLRRFKELDEYPKNTGEHNALADAKWNRELYNLLKIM